MPLMNPTREELPEPMLGRLLIELIEDKVEDYLKEKAGIGRDSILAIPVSSMENVSVPMTRGILLEKAPDAFGDAYQKKYGSDGPKAPEVGDTVFFVKNSAYQLDIENKYHMISDDDVVGVTRC